jgi:hypothetical protein
VHGEFDTHVYRSWITKQGARLTMSAAIEAVAAHHGGAPFRGGFEAIAERRDSNQAIAREVLTLVSPGLRNSTIRCLVDQEAAWGSAPISRARVTGMAPLLEAALWSN